MSQLPEPADIAQPAAIAPGSVTPPVPATEPPAAVIASPAPEAATEPATERAPEPATKRAPEPATEPAKEPAADAAVTPPDTEAAPAPPEPEGVGAIPVTVTTPAAAVTSPTADAPAAPSLSGRPAASPTRLVVGIALGAALAALGALLLGEYPFTGVMPYIAGVLFALVVAEVMVSVSHRSGRATAVAAALCTAGGLAWGVWISVGEGKAPIPIGGWVAVVIGLVVALFRGGITAGGQQGPSSRPAS